MRDLSEHAHRLLAPLLPLLAALASACAVPAEHPALEQADARLEQARRSPRVRALAAVELDRAEVALEDARAAARAGAPADQVEHMAYLVSQRAALAEARAAQQVAKSQIAMLQGAPDQALAHRRPEPRRHGRASPLPRHRQRPAMAPDQARAPLEEARSAPAVPLEGQEARPSLPEGQEVPVANPESAATDVATSRQEITLSLAQLSFEGAEPSSAAREQLAALAERLLREPGRGVSIEADFDLPDPEARTEMERRVEVVRAILRQRGVAPARLVVRAVGDGPAPPQATSPFAEAPG
jgi:outer membrane protein OmpA-like peptidoglycan-associated protein